jgi:hypothetical protein
VRQQERKRCDIKTCRVPIQTHNLPVLTATTNSAFGETAHVQPHEEDRPDASLRKFETGEKFEEKYFSLKIAS